jgi:hypothetical protein
MATTTVDAPTPERETSEAAEHTEEVPPLHNGDRLTRKEFERRYDAMPPGVKAELIEGVVYMTASVRVKSHGQPHALVMSWLGVYAAATPGVLAADNSTARFDPDNEPQPDATLFIDPACGGQASISEDDYLEGAPELAAEVAASPATTCTTKNAPTAATACRSTSSGARARRRSTGSSSKTNATCG